MKNNILIIFLLSLAITLSLVSCQDEEENKSWCWTAPEKLKPGDIWDVTKGGLNWGYCADLKKEEEQVFYKVTVTTANMEGSESDAEFFLKIFGEEGQTPDITLSKNGFGKGTVVTFKLMGKNVGDVNQIRLTQKGKDAYRCLKIRVEQGTRLWDFDCDDFINCPTKCSEDMFLVGNQLYTVTCQTEGTLWAGTKDPVYIQFQGPLAKTPKKILSETGFEKGELRTVDIISHDVGPIYAITVSMTQEDSWIPKKCIVKRSIGDEVEFEFRGMSVKCPARCKVTITNFAVLEKVLGISLSGNAAGDVEKKKKEEEEGSSSSSGGGGGGGSSSAGGSHKKYGEICDGNAPNILDLGVEDIALFGDYAGGGLTDKERDSIEQISCDDIVKGSDRFGPMFNDVLANHKVTLVKCPVNCQNPGETEAYGVGIHPEEASVCRSALVDRSMPIVGGVIGVGILKGIENYQNSDPYLGAKSGAFGKSEKSYTTFKVDNIDMAAKDMRLVDAEGLITYVGRLEFRMDGVWGTTCYKGMTSGAARRVCRDMFFADGIMKTPEDDGAGFCKEFKGENYCGAADMPIHFSALSCQGSENHIMACYREMAGEDCGHDDDVIVECTMVNFDLAVEPDSGNIRLLDAQGSPAAKGAGRLEMWTKGIWGTICNFKFNDQSANVACKQMGFTSGKIIGKENAVGTCNKFDGKNHCGKESQPIHFRDMECKGTEAFLRGCGSNPPNGCSHESDVIIECEGSGDATGKSQKITPKVVSPMLGKLPLPPIINANCQTKAVEEIFRGDPGSIFLISCPPDCVKQAGSVWGTGIYTTDSSICRAAIQAGVLQDMGGVVLLVKHQGLEAYAGSSRRGVLSASFETWESSFTVSKPNSLALKLSESFSSRKPFVPSFMEISSTTSLVSRDGMKDLVSTLTKSRNSTNYQRFPKFEEIEKLSNLSQMLKARNTKKPKSSHRYNITESSCYSTSSYLQTHETLKLSSKHKSMATEEPKQKKGDPIFLWHPPYPGFKIDGTEKSIISTVGMPGADQTGKIKVFSFAIRVKMDKSDKKQKTIIGHSGCGCYAVLMDELDEVVLAERCGKTEFRTGFYMPLRWFVTLIFVYDGTNVALYAEGDLFNRVQISFNFNCPKTFDIGAFSEMTDEIWNGEFEFVAVWNVPIESELIGKISNKGIPVPPKGKGLPRRQTKDGRVCLEDCSTNPFPGTPGGPSPPGGSLPGQPDYDNDGKDHGDANPFIEGMNSAEAREMRNKDTDGSIRPPSSIAIILRCDTLATEPELQGPSGKSIRVHCPKNCLATLEGNVLGTTIFTDHSAICKAGIHSGILKNEDGGEMLCVIANGQQYYPGKFMNGLQSAASGAHERSIVLKEAPPLIEVKCDDPANLPIFIGITGTTFAILCPKDCSRRKIKVYGDLIYSDDSSICQAAIHAGVMNDRGGEIQLIIDRGMPKYKSKKRNNVMSDKRGEYMRSFRALGDTSSMCIYFRENYRPPNIFENWKILDSKSSRDGPSQWSFNIHPTVLKLAIRETSNIKGSDMNYPTLLLHRNFDCGQGLIKVNMYFEEATGTAVVLLRFYDIRNFYAVEINKKTGVRFVKKVDGKGEELISKPYNIAEKLWYRIRIVMFDDTFKVYIQEGPKRRIEKILEYKDPDIQRGSLALSTDGAPGIVFDAVEIKEYDPKYGISEKRTEQINYDVCLQGSSKSKRKSFCKEKFAGYKPGAVKCEQSMNYCQFCCDSEIRRVIDEKIAEDQEMAIQISLDSGIWIPTDQERVDIKPNQSGGHAIPGIISKIDWKYKNEAKPHQYKITIEYDWKGSKKNEELMIPNENVARCGILLTGRTDCQ